MKMEQRNTHVQMLKTQLIFYIYKNKEVKHVTIRPAH